MKLKFKGESRTPTELTASKMELFGTLVTGFQQFTLMSQDPMLDVAEVLDLSLEVFQNYFWKITSPE